MSLMLDEIINYLDKIAPESETYQPRNPYCCPVSRYITNTHGVVNTVGIFNIYLDYGNGDIQTMIKIPPDVKRFITAIDNKFAYGSVVSRSRVLEIAIESREGC